MLVAVCRILRSGTWAQLLPGTWDLSSKSRIEAVSPALEVGFLASEPPGRPQSCYTPLCWGSGHGLGGTSASGSLTSCCQRVGQGCGLIRMLHPGRICSQAHGVVGRIQVLVGCWTSNLGSTWLLVGTALNSLPLGPLQCGSLHHYWKPTSQQRKSARKSGSSVFFFN